MLLKLLKPHVLLEWVEEAHATRVSSGGTCYCVSRATCAARGDSGDL